MTKGEIIGWGIATFTTFGTLTGCGDTSNSRATPIPIDKRPSPTFQTTPVVDNNDPGIITDATPFNISKELGNQIFPGAQEVVEPTQTPTLK